MAKFPLFYIFNKNTNTINMNKKGFIHGAFILTVFGLVGKFIGAIYRVPLTRIIGVEGLGLYQMVFPLYSLLLTVSSSAFPNAISKMLSEAYASNKINDAKNIFKVSVKILLILSSLCFLFVIVFAKLIAKLQGNIGVEVCYYAIAPAIIIVSIIASLRGYFQAKENMKPSAVSGLIEQCVKLIFGLLFATLFVKQGVIWGAFGALLGVCISELFALVYLLICYAKEPKTKAYVKLNQKNVAKNIFKVTLPITFGSIILPLSQFIDSALIVNLLVMSGFNVVVATEMFGIQTGIVGAIINMPVVFSLSIASAILPMISRQNVLNKKELTHTINKSIYITLGLGLLAGIAVFICAKPIIFLLYGGSLKGDNITLASNLLRLASISIVYLSMTQTTTGILQGLGKYKTPVIALLIGGVIKLVLNIVLVKISNINIFGAEIATILCYGVAAVINLFSINNIKGNDAVIK